MQRMIRDLLDLTRIESGHFERRLADVDLGEAAAAAMSTVAGPAAARGITLELRTRARSSCSRPTAARST